MLLAGLLATTGCGGDDVHVDEFAVGSAGQACARLIEALPRELAGQPRRTVSGSAYAAAWGDPAIVLRCGVPVPKSFKSDPCFTRNGIGWSIPGRQVDDLDEDVTMTLAFRDPTLQVQVPAHYRPDGPTEVMADLDAVLRDRTTSTGEHCS